MPIVAKALTPELFEPFGQIMGARGSDPQRDEFAARLENGRGHARGNLTFIRTAPAVGPTVVSVVERHPHSSQLFVPVNGTRFLVAVCPSRVDGEPDLDALVAFVAAGRQSVNYSQGTWHAPLTVIGGAGEFVMLRFDDGGPEDTELRSLPEPLIVDLSGVEISGSGGPGPGGVADTY